MLKVGITGGIGTGKTTACKVFELLGIPVYYSDIRAKLLMGSDPDLIKKIKDRFGEQVYLDNGEPDRKLLASLVFNDADKLAALNGLVHPAVFYDFDLWSRQQNSPYVLKEAAILFESGSDRDCDYTIVVTSPLDLRIKRVISRDHLSLEAIKKRMDKQLPDSDKIKLATFKLVNDESTLLIPQILHLHEHLLLLNSEKK